ncbi:hypothetical protein Aperf_G00000058144 [Anoplocephala perfoliata]
MRFTNLQPPTEVHGLDFIRACFQLDPADRATTDCLLKHKFLENVARFTPTSCVSPLPPSPNSTSGVSVTPSVVICGPNCVPVLPSVQQPSQHTTGTMPNLTSCTNTNLNPTSTTNSPLSLAKIATTSRSFLPTNLTSNRHIGGPGTSSNATSTASQSPKHVGGGKKADSTYHLTNI